VFGSRSCSFVSWASETGAKFGLMSVSAEDKDGECTSVFKHISFYHDCNAAGCMCRIIAMHFGETPSTRGELRSMCQTYGGDYLYQCQ
jgi:hypothetical protein